MTSPRRQLVRVALTRWPTSPRGVRNFLRRPGTLPDFFEKHFRLFAPSAKRFLRAQVYFPGAFSPSSVLTKVSLTVTGRTGKKIIHLRGNRVSAGSVAILRTVHRSVPYQIPYPIWYNPNAEYFFYEEVPGQRLRELNFRQTQMSNLMAKVGRALGDLHRIPAGTLVDLKFKDELRALNALRHHLTKARFRQGPELLSALRHLQVWEKKWWHRLPKVICHNDFQGSNILVTPTKRVNIIDFSRSGRGPLPIDAGQFIGHLTVMLGHHLSHTAITRLRKSFFDAYCRRLPKSWRPIVTAALPGFELRMALEILGISSLFLTGKKRDHILSPLLKNIPPLPRL